MDDDKKVSRSQFLGILGSMAVTAFVIKVAYSKEVISAVIGKQKSSTIASNRYGNNAYGGTKG
jgi:hypothetical protein